MESNLIGELNIMKEMEMRPNFSEVGRRYGVDRHTVAKYWNGGGAQPDDGRESAFDAYRREIEDRAQLPGVTAMNLKLATCVAVGICIAIRMVLPRL